MQTKYAQPDDVVSAPRTAESLAVNPIETRQSAVAALSNGVGAVVRAVSRLWTLLKWREPASAGPSAPSYATFGDIYLAAIRRR